MKKQVEDQLHTIETTIGELVEALTLVAQESGNSEWESYELTSEALGQILYRNDVEFDVPQ